VRLLAIFESPGTSSDDTSVFVRGKERVGRNKNEREKRVEIDVCENYGGASFFRSGGKKAFGV